MLALSALLALSAVTSRAEVPSGGIWPSSHQEWRVMTDEDDMVPEEQYQNGGSLASALTEAYNVAYCSGLMITKPPSIYDVPRTIRYTPGRTAVGLVRFNPNACPNGVGLAVAVGTEILVDEVVKIVSTVDEPPDMSQNGTCISYNLWDDVHSETLTNSTPYWNFTWLEHHYHYYNWHYVPPEYTSGYYGYTTWHDCRENGQNSIGNQLMFLEPLHGSQDHYCTRNEPSANGWIQTQRTHWGIYRHHWRRILANPDKVYRDITVRWNFDYWQDRQANKMAYEYFGTEPISACATHTRLGNAPLNVWICKYFPWSRRRQHTDPFSTTYDIYRIYGVQFGPNGIFDKCRIPNMTGYDHNPYMPY
jgi:hypothetical protein